MEKPSEVRLISVCSDQQYALFDFAGCRITVDGEDCHDIALHIIDTLNERWRDK